MGDPYHGDPLRQQIAATIVELAPLSPQQWSVNTALVDDLGYDSLSGFELVLELERTLELDPIPEDAAADVETVDELVQLLVRYVHPGAERQ